MQPPSPYRQLAHSLDPVVFAAEALAFVADPWQETLLRSTERQIILNCSRQSGKSTCTAVLAVHRAIFSPGALILLISPSLRQSKELFSKVVAFLKSVQPSVTLDEDNKSSATPSNGSRIVSLPGDERTIRGYSAPNLILCDEASFTPDELFTSIKPMLAVSRGQLILMSTPFGRRGFFFEVWQSGGEAWKRISVPASSCPRISKEFLRQELESMSEWRFKQEYECVFCETTDQIFSFDTIRQMFDPAVRPLFTNEEVMMMGARR
jgi:hypothetical protein